VLVSDLPVDLAVVHELAFDVAPVAVLAMDGEGRIRLTNLELERQFGYARGELTGASVDLLMPGAAPMFRGLLSEPSQPAEAETPTVRRAIRGLRKDGSEFSLDVFLKQCETTTGPLLIASVAPAVATDHGAAAGRAALEEALAFERSIAALSSCFIDVSTDRIDDAIRDGLSQACELVQLDRAAVLRLGPEGVIRSRIAWSVAEVEPVDTTIILRDRFPWTFDQLLSGDVVSFASLEEVPDEVDRRSYAAAGLQSSIALPLLMDGRVTAFIGFGAVQAPRSWSPPLVDRLNVIAGVFSQVVARQQRDEALQAAMEESQRLKNQLHVENVFLRTEARDRLAPAEIVGRSTALRQVLAQAEQVASTDSTVLLLGETGTGKELFASHIHSLSARRGRPMVRVNCAAIPATLIESELFGREKGAFTGALARQVGRFELADHSTIFLDEIGDLPVDVQVKLLRVLEERKFERLGSPRPISVDTRIIAATHRNLEQRVAEGAFREDLYYRLNVFPIQVPPLRDRAEDIPLLVQRLVDEFSRTFGKRVEMIERETMTALQRYTWPGNIRELRNVVERAMIVTTSKRLVIPLPESTSAAVARSPKLVDVERDHILAVLESSSWRIRGSGGAAARLGMKPTTLETRMAKLGLKRPATG
jgi:formate hydrogenlyase transcriptional activator